MKAAIEQFRENIQRVKNLETLHAYLATNIELDMIKLKQTQMILFGV